MFEKKTSEDLMNELAGRLASRAIPDPSSALNNPQEPSLPSLQDRLQSLAQGVGYLDALDEKRILADLETLQGALAQYKSGIEQYDDFQPYLNIKLPDGRGFLDLSAGDIEKLVGQLAQSGDIQQSEQLDAAYKSFMAILNRRAQHLNDYQQLQQQADLLMDTLDWKRVQNSAVEQFPELKPHLQQLTETIKKRLSHDPLASYLNKYLLLKEAIDDIGPSLFKGEQAQTVITSLAIDNPTALKKTLSGQMDGKPRYQMETLKRKDYKSLSDEELKDIQLAMFEGRIL